MRHPCFALLLVAATFLTAGFRCGDCYDAYCYPALSVRFLSKADGSDLFTNGTYDADKLQVFARLSNTTTFSQQSHVLPTTNDSSGMYVRFNIQKDVAAFIFQFNDQESDTLQVRHYLDASECCGEKINFTYGIFHGDTVHEERNGFLILKK